MFIRKFSPLFAPDNEGGVDGGAGDTEVIEQDSGTDGADTGGKDSAQEQADGPGSGRSDIRKSLEKGFADANKAAEKAPKKPKGKAKAATSFDAVRERQGADDPAPVEGDVVEGAEGEEADGGEEAPKLAVPEGFTASPEEWAKTPPAVQAAITKRLEETSNGVKQIQAKYADIDKALSPHLEAIRRHGHTPGQAVNQLFSWFQAIAANPAASFPALAKSFNYDWNKIKALPAYGEQPGQQPQVGADGKPVEASPDAIPPGVQQYISQLEQKLGMVSQTMEQRFGSIEQGFQQQQEAKTQEILGLWSKDKPHFEEVRELMAHFIQSGAVPLKNDQVDLDGAYEMAIFAQPTVRAKVLAAQEAAKIEAKKKADAAALKLQQDAATKARKAGVGAVGGAPGVGGTGQPAKKGQRMSVRDSLKSAIEEVRNG